MNKTVWLFPQNSCNINQFFLTLKVFGKLNGIDRGKNMQQELMDIYAKNGLYNPYVEKDHYDTSSANHKIDEARFYGAIYETSNRKIHVSSYGELLIKYIDDFEKRNKVFIAMLYSIQFNNPYKKMEGFDIYPLRLIFELLCDERIDKNLTNLEIALILYKIDSVKTKEKYNQIIESILKYRNSSEEEKKQKLINDATQFVKSYVSCNYLFNILKDLNIVNQEKEENAFFIKSQNRVKPTSVSKRTIKLNAVYEQFIINYKNTNSVYEPTKKPETLRSDWIREIYNSIPESLLKEIGEVDSMYTKYLQIPKLLMDSSIDPNKWSLFEEYITQSFNLFTDIKAERIGGPGQPDSLCHFLKNNTLFCADGKSTQNKLSSVNDGRLKQHRELYKAKYTIVVTPDYVPSALSDIKGTDTCIITSHCFADLITKYIFKLYKNREECSYEIFNQLLLNNLGTDLSEKIYKIIDDKLGISIDDLS